MGAGNRVGELHAHTGISPIPVIIHFGFRHRIQYLFHFRAMKHDIDTLLQKTSSDTFPYVRVRILECMIRMSGFKVDPNCRHFPVPSRIQGKGAGQCLQPLKNRFRQTLSLLHSLPAFVRGRITYLLKKSCRRCASNSADMSTRNRVFFAACIPATPMLGRNAFRLTH